MPRGSTQLERDLLAQAFPGQLRTQRAFEDLGQDVADNTAAVATTTEATQALQDATVLTLSANATLNNERVLALSGGLLGEDVDGQYRLSIDGTVVRSGNTWEVTLIPPGNCTLFLPLTGTLATRAGIETFINKTLQTPKITSIGDYADDTAAAAGGVPVTGVYRTGSTLKVRVT